MDARHFLGCGQQPQGIGCRARHDGDLGNVGSQVGYVGEQRYHPVGLGSACEVVVRDDRCNTVRMRVCDQVGYRGIANPCFDVHHIDAARFDERFVERHVCVYGQIHLPALVDRAKREQQGVVRQTIRHQARILDHVWYVVDVAAEIPAPFEAIDASLPAALCRGACVCSFGVHERDDDFGPSLPDRHAFDDERFHMHPPSRGSGFLS